MTGKPRLLDLFCGAGGAAMGYSRAGFEVVGVDIKPQPHYPFAFHQGDALSLPPLPFDAIHASPPCQAYSAVTAPKYRANHPDLVGPTREMLDQIGVQYVIENVPGAPLRRDLELCGTMFGLGVLRHRWFELSWPAPLVAPCAHIGTVKAGDYCGVHGGGDPGGHTREEKGAAMGIDWMLKRELNNAVPPAYTEWIGHRLLEVLG